MTTPVALAAAGAITAVPATGPLSLSEALHQGVSAIGALPNDVSQWPLLLQLSEAFPLIDVVFGGVMLILVVLMHATGIRFISRHFVRREQLLSNRATEWRVDLLMGGAVALLLSLHIAENILWTAVLEMTGLIPGWRAAGFFVGNTYTTIGYGTFLLPAKWEMLAPIIAISGLFTFGWSGSVLVNFVQRARVLQDAALAPTRKLH